MTEEPSKEKPATTSEKQKHKLGKEVIREIELHFGIPFNELQEIVKEQRRRLEWEKAEANVDTETISPDELRMTDDGSSRKRTKESPKNMRPGKPKQRDELSRLIGRRIREYRHKRGWNQIDLEAHIDEVVSRSAISQFETGACLPALRTLQEISDAFGVDIVSFFLNPSESYRHRVAMAVLECKNQNILKAVGKLLDVE